MKLTTQTAGELFVYVCFLSVSTFTVEVLLSKFFCWGGEVGGGRVVVMVGMELGVGGGVGVREE